MPMLRVKLFQDRRAQFDGPAREVVLPGDEGDVSVLADHAPMLCVLGQGMVQIDDQQFPVQWGIARVERNQVVMVTH